MRKNLKICWLAVLLLLPVLLFQVCAGDGSNLDPLGNPLGPPRLGVTPNAVNLTLDKGNTIDVTLEVQNVGGKPLVITSIQAMEAWVSLQTVNLPIELGAAEAISFSATIGQEDLDAGLFLGSVLFSSNDEETPNFDLQITLEISVEILPFEPDFSNIETFIFSPICTECHSGGNAPKGLSLKKGDSYNNLVNVRSVEKPEYFRVEPFNPDNSYIIRKLEGGPDISEGRMPLDRTPIPQDQINVVRRWIANGAVNN